MQLVKINKEDITDLFRKAAGIFWFSFHLSRLLVSTRIGLKLFFK